MTPLRDRIDSLNRDISLHSATIQDIARAIKDKAAAKETLRAAGAPLREINTAIAELRSRLAAEKSARQRLLDEKCIIQASRPIRHVLPDAASHSEALRIYQQAVASGRVHPDWPKIIRQVTRGPGAVYRMIVTVPPDPDELLPTCPKCGASMDVVDGCLCHAA
jgi:hypothetical protein